ncbi:hypothetical protein C8A05DRAFT_31933 [Staphylotrichum tortipilum]|uniref:NTF2 domain-containing protein n=1 Tax=Staphylotrichum tortipilum TaxID=2831512 RepID=A0AAN6MPT9_9PEZI|nr:hypothetical protein C8A05DRAFT_31933 [Staphylotrichum longicolle]
MSANSHETNIRCSCEAAKNFTDWYYYQINEGKAVAHGYVNGHDAYDRAGHPPADICINGLVVATPQEWEKLLEQQRQAPKQPDPNKRRVRYEVETLDAHVLNADYRFAAPQKMIDLHAPTDGVRMMLHVTTTGTVYFGTGRSAITTSSTSSGAGGSGSQGADYWEKQEFRDTFILVPNWDMLEKVGTRHGRKYLAISHNYRAS